MTIMLSAWHKNVNTHYYNVAIATQYINMPTASVATIRHFLLIHSALRSFHLAAMATHQQHNAQICASFERSTDLVLMHSVYPIMSYTGLYIAVGTCIQDIFSYKLTPNGRSCPANCPTAYEKAQNCSL